jgi:hypothetical protein
MKRESKLEIRNSAAFSSFEIRTSAIPRVLGISIFVAMARSREGTHA